MTMATHEQQPPKQLSPKQEAIQKVSSAIETAVRDCGIEAVRNQPAFMKAVRLAHGIKMIREALTEQFVRDNFIPLMGTKLGFLADKDYNWETVRDVLCEALLRGFQPVGNEFNIIAGSFYGAKNGFERIVREWPGLSDLQVDLGVPHLVADKGALVPCAARWLLDGEVMELVCIEPPQNGVGIDTRIPVRVNGGMGPDAILGKAMRKLYARVYQRLTGCEREIVDSEPEIIPVEGLPALASPKDDGRRIKMNGNGKKADEAPPQREPGED